MKMLKKKLGLQAEVGNRIFSLPLNWPLSAQYVLALSIIALALLLRGWLGVYLEDRVPFSLTLGVLLVLILLVQPGPFLSAAFVGWWGSVYFFLPPKGSFVFLDEPAEIVSWFIGLTLIIAAVVAVVIRHAHNRREAALAESEKRYRTLFESIDEGFCIIQILFDERGKPEDFKFIECNPAFEKHSGLSDVAGKTAFELVPDLERHWLNTFAMVHLTGESIRFEEHTNKVGDRWFNLFAFRMGPQKDCRVAVLFSDITEERRDKESLRQSRERSRMVSLATNDVIYDWNVNTGELHWNQAVKDIFGYHPEEVIPTIQWWTEHLHPEDRDRVTNSLYSSVESEKSLWRENYRFRRADGSYVMVADRGYVGFNIEGKAERMIGSMRDETERLAAERALQKSEELFQEMVDHAPVIVWLTDKQGETTYLSKSWYDFTGQVPNEGLGFGWLKMVHPDDRAGAEEIFLAAPDSRKFIRLNYRILNKEGGYSWVVDMGKPRFGHREEFLGYVGSVTDISDRKELEDVLREADQKKDQFLAVLAHELRNPLAAIRMATTVLRKAQSDRERIKKMGEVIERQSRQLSQLIDDLLDVSRITRGQVVLHRKHFDIASAVAESVEGVREACKQKDLKLSVESSDNLLVVNADPVRIAQVIGNLLTNSCKFTDKGKILVKIEKEAETAVVRVMDTGVGIASRDLENIFEMFTQVQRNGQTESGLGIGLALSKSIVALHGGKLKAFSEGPGKGSEFRVEIPLAEAPRAEPDIDEVEIQSGSEKRGFDEARRVLVVDDNIDALEATGLVLQMIGHHVKLAQDGLKALDLAEEFSPEVILLDIGLPGMDGYEVAKRIRKKPWGANLFLIAMTGWGQTRDKEESKKAGFDAHLTKPVDPEELEQILRTRRREFKRDELHAV